MTTQPADVFRLFFAPGEVTEIRSYGLRGNNAKGWEGFATDIVYGYFDGPEAFQDAARVLEKAKAPGIYFVLNPVLPDLLARANNRLIAAGRKGTTTSDRHVAAMRWVYIDIDPRRPAGISSTDELASAVELRDRIHRHLVEERSVPEAGTVRALSGNGAHLLVRMPDLPPDESNALFVRRTLASLASRFDTDRVEVDRKTFNPARICKLYGTTARKGDDIPARPHRRSRLEGVGYGPEVRHTD